MKRGSTLYALPLVALLGCASTGLSPDTLRGVWGAEGFSLRVSDSETEVRVNCGGATLPIALPLDSEQRFAHSFEMVYVGGAPPREGQSNVVRRAARIVGRVSGAFLPIELTVEGASTRFVLRKGVEGVTYACP